MPELGEPISERELDVLNCLAEGASNREIADRLSISHNTVKVHVRNIFTKLGVSSRTEATTVALQKGMLSIPGIATEATLEEEDEQVEEFSGDGEEAPGQGNGTTETATAATVGTITAGEPAPPEAIGDAPKARTSSQGAFSVRQLVAVVGVLAVLALALAVNNLLGGNVQTPQDATLTIESTAPAAETFEETALGDNWVVSRAMPEARARMAVATVGLNIYAIGGESANGIDNRVLIFDSQQHDWREGAAKFTAVAGAAAAVLSGEIYVAGGYGTNGAPTTAVEAYSPLNNAWRPVTALPQATAGAVAVVSNGLLYLFGGENGDGVLDSSLVYDPGTQQWQSLPSMPTARTMAAGGVLGNKLYVVGGSDGSQALKTCEVYDADTEEWSECPPLQAGRSAGGSAAFQNKLFVLGGNVEDGADDEAAYGEVYDAAEQSWTRFNIPMLTGAADWPYLGVSNVETHIYTLGGEHGGEMSDALYVYRPLVYRFFIPAASAGGE